MASDEQVVSGSPFPGARPQVAGFRYEDSGQTPQEAPHNRSLPLESGLTAFERGWSVRLPVRAEHVSVDKQVVVYERVLVRRREIDDSARVQGNVRREELRVTADRNENLPPTDHDGSYSTG